MDTITFVNWFGGLVSRVSENSAYFPSVLIAQGILESNYGKSILSKNHNNYFGIKTGSSWKGDSVNMNTGEVFDNKEVIVNDAFRAYNNPESSIKNRIEWMMNEDRYSNVKEASTPNSQAQAIQNAGYATDPNYSNKLISIIEKYDLTKFDKNRNIMKNISIAVSVLLITAAALTMYKTLKY